MRTEDKDEEEGMEGLESLESLAPSDVLDVLEGEGEGDLSSTTPPNCWYPLVVAMSCMVLLHGIMRSIAVNSEFSSYPFPSDDATLPTPWTMSSNTSAMGRSISNSLSVGGPTASTTTTATEAYDSSIAQPSTKTPTVGSPT